ncbi:MAG: ThiF family adenylyltransferase, partial [Candidatus Hodarchaeota archaeon]
MKLTDKLRERYSRTISLHDITEADMEALINTTVSVVGAGGLGSPALRLLTALGFGRIRIIDRDVVELSNIQRQTVYNTQDIDMPKAEAAAANLSLMNPNVEFEPLSVSLDEGNARELLKESDIIIDGLDSFQARHAVNKASVAMNIPYIFAGAIEYQANISTFIPRTTGCLNCFIGEASDDPDYTCANVGVSSELLSIAAAIEVREAVLLSTGKTPILGNRLMVIDLYSLNFDFFDLGRSENCEVCSTTDLKFSEKSEDPIVTVLCSGAFHIAPTEITTLDLESIATQIETSNKVTKTGRSITVELSPGLQITLMQS